MAGSTKPKPAPSSRRARAVVARAEGASPADGARRFTATFTAGSDPACELRIVHPAVKPQHVQVLFDGILWWIRHVADGGVTRVEGAPIQMVPLTGEVKVQLGEGGPVLGLALAEAGAAGQDEAEPARAAAGAAAQAAGGAASLSEAEIIQRYFRPASDGPAGHQTMMFRAAFASVQKRSSRRYHLVIAAILLVLVSAGGVIAWQLQRIRALQGSAERFFYAMKTFELRTALLEDLVLASTDPTQAAALVESRAKLKHMEGEYDAFVRELGVYGKVPERQRFILRLARRFGECEVNVPKDFVAEVERYVERWRADDRLANALRRARANGYGPAIARTFADAGLPPQFVYLALQESNFDFRAVGPPTRYGFAKGMWQFIPLTAHKFGLKIGPLYDQAAYDPEDERFEWPKATRAAARYLRQLTNTEAQASGLLAMASYNWGEHNIQGIIASLPEDPSARNFWRLLKDHRIPAETFDYVLSIFSAALICEDPARFGFDVECPLPPQPGIDELGRDRGR